MNLKFAGWILGIFASVLVAGCGTDNADELFLTDQGGEQCPEGLVNCFDILNPEVPTGAYPVQIPSFLSAEEIVALEAAQSVCGLTTNCPEVGRFFRWTNSNGDAFAFAPVPSLQTLEDFPSTDPDNSRIVRIVGLIGHTGLTQQRAEELGRGLPSRWKLGNGTATGVGVYGNTHLGSSRERDDDHPNQEITSSAVWMFNIASLLGADEFDPEAVTNLSRTRLRQLYRTVRGYGRDGTLAEFTSGQFARELNGFFLGPVVADLHQSRYLTSGNSGSAVPADSILENLNITVCEATDLLFDAFLRTENCLTPIARGSGNDVYSDIDIIYTGWLPFLKDWKATFFPDATVTSGPFVIRNATVRGVTRYTVQNLDSARRVHQYNGDGLSFEAKRIYLSKRVFGYHLRIPSDDDVQSLLPSHYTAPTANIGSYATYDSSDNVVLLPAFSQAYCEWDLFRDQVLDNDRGVFHDRTIPRVTIKDSVYYDPEAGPNCGFNLDVLNYIARERATAEANGDTFLRYVFIGAVARDAETGQYIRTLPINDYYDSCRRPPNQGSNELVDDGLSPAAQAEFTCFYFPNAFAKSAPAVVGAAYSSSLVVSRGFDTVAAYAAAVVARIRFHWPSLTAYEVVDVMASCARPLVAPTTANPDGLGDAGTLVGGVVDLECLFSDSTTLLTEQEVRDTLLANVPTYSASTTVAKIFGGFGGAGFALTGLQAKDAVMGHSLSYSSARDGASALFARPERGMLAENGHGRLSLWSQGTSSGALAQGVRLAVNRACAVSGALGIESGTFAGGFGTGTFAVGDTISAFAGGSCALEAGTLQITPWIGLRVASMVSPADGVSRMEEMHGAELLAGLEVARPLARGVSMELSLQHGQGTTGQARLAGQALELSPEPWTRLTAGVSLRW